MTTATATKTRTKTIRAAAYARLSLDRNGEGIAVDRQLTDSRRIADGRGWELVAEFSDNSLSAWRTTVRRPGWEDLLAMIERGELDAVVIYHGDRLIRQPRDLERLIQLADNGLLIASVAGERDLGNADDRFILRIETAAACRESDNTSRRVRRELQDRAERGQRMTAVLYGWRDPSEAEVVRRIVRDLTAGRSPHAITAELNAEGIPSPEGGTWIKASVRWIGRRPANAGLQKFRGEVIGTGDWPALITEAEHAAVLRATDTKNPQPGNNTRKHLMTGLLVCGRCGAGMVHHRPQPQRRVYRCATGHLVIRAQEVEDAVRDLLEALAKDAPATDTAGPVLAELAAVEARRAEAAADYADGLLSRELLREVNAKTEARIAELNAQAARLERKTAVPPDIRNAPLDVQRTTIAAWLRITAMPLPKGASVKTPAVDRLQVEWLTG